MPANTTSLWPDDFGTIAVPSPVAILRQQAVALGAKTGNIVVGRVYTQGGEIVPGDSDRSFP